MESSGVQGHHPKDRARPPPVPRTASRSSTSSTKTRMTAQSNTSSTNYSQSSPTTPSSHSHRYYHNQCNRPSIADRPRSQLSREAIEASDQEMPSVSSFLKERLERERKVESERLAGRLSNEMMSVSLDLRASQNSPLRSEASEGRRPRSSGGGEPSKKKGLGLKEMEQAVSTLHKQNFDLKLELFHRRERQAVLEEQVEKLKKGKEQADDINEKLTFELNKRDKAVEEAVAMIVVLEARVKQLLCEREMVHQVEAHSYFSTQSPSSPYPDQSTPRNRGADLPDPSDDTKNLMRMPSFLSERSENTANLRNVYLGTRGSLLSLPKTTGDSPDGNRSDIGGINSPSLSVLSESSFMSIYGQKNAVHGTRTSIHETSLDCETPNHRFISMQDRSTPPNLTLTPRQGSTSSSRPVEKENAQLDSIVDMLGVNGSPLQRLERSLRPAKGTPSTILPNYEQDWQSQDRRSRIPGQPTTKQEKRGALHKVLTDGLAVGRDSNQLDMLPPTPDTISTSTLRHYENSDDALYKDRNSAVGRSYHVVPKTMASRESHALDKDLLGSLARSYQGSLAKTTKSPVALSGNNNDFDRCLRLGQIQRPRSVDGTTIGNSRGLDGWDTESSDEERVNATRSAISPYDCWMLEGMKPEEPDILRPLSSISQAEQGPGAERASPDLFSFPIATGGWATDIMFGSLDGNGYMGTGKTVAGPSLPVQTAGSLGESLASPRLFGSGLNSAMLASDNGPPPPPNRRSSLHARTGSTAAVIGSSPGISPQRPAPVGGKLRKSPGRGNKTRSNSVDTHSPSQSASEGGLRQERASTVPPRQATAPPRPTQEHEDHQSNQTQRHYPPTTSHTSRSRGLSLFRRSGGFSDSPHRITPSSAPPTEASFRNLPAPAVGIPSWGKRNFLVDDERSSATPPPILRSKDVLTRVSNQDGGVSLEPPSGGVLVTSNSESSRGGGDVLVGTIQPTTPKGHPIVNVLGNTPRLDGSGKRRWLGLGRVSSLKSRDN